ncbi:MAG: hypothetical protein AAGE61_05040 [Pseudomonadota bacterium]
MKLLSMAAFGAAMLMSVGAAQAASEPQRVSLTGEVMDTWCYYSGVMGGQDAVVGTAHHTCAIWCAAGGIPIGLLADDGEVYIILELEGVGTADGKPSVLGVQSDRLTVDAMMYERDGFKYIVVDKITNNEGITNLNHNDFGPIPGFAIPKSLRGG